MSWLSRLDLIVTTALVVATEVGEDLGEGRGPAVDAAALAAGGPAAYGLHSTVSSIQDQLVDRFAAVHDAGFELGVRTTVAEMQRRVAQKRK